MVFAVTYCSSSRLDQRISDLIDSGFKAYYSPIAGLTCYHACECVGPTIDSLLSLACINLSLSSTSQAYFTAPFSSMVSSSISCDHSFRCSPKTLPPAV